MKPMLLAFLAMGLIAVAAPVVLNQLGFSTEDATTSPGVRS